MDSPEANSTAVLTSVISPFANIRSKSKSSSLLCADKIFVIKDGNVEAVGTQDKLLNSCELYRKMWEAHTMAKDEDVDAFDPRRKEETANA